MVCSCSERCSHSWAPTTRSSRPRWALRHRSQLPRPLVPRPSWTVAHPPPLPLPGVGEGQAPVFKVVDLYAAPFSNTKEGVATSAPPCRVCTKPAQAATHTHTHTHRALAKKRDVPHHHGVVLDASKTSEEVQESETRGSRRRKKYSLTLQPAILRCDG
jgi:hypothetical protein